MKPSAPIRATRLVTRCSALTSATKDKLYESLQIATENYKSAPVQYKPECAADVMAACKELKEGGAFQKWGVALEDIPLRRQVGLGELRLVGVKYPEAIAQVSVRNDAAFLFTVVGSTSLLAVILGQLPGDWGFFGAYLTGAWQHR